MLTVYFCPHFPEAVTLQLGQLIASADVVSMEMAHNGAEAAEYERLTQLVSNGVSNPQAVLNIRSPFYPFSLALYRKLYNSHKRIVMERSPVSEAADRATNSMIGPAFRQWENWDLDKAIKSYLGYASMFSNNVINRDKQYASQLDKLILPRKETVLSVRGLLHSETLSQILNAKNIEFDKITFPMSYKPSPDEVVTLKMTRGENPSKEDVLRCLIQHDLIGNDHSYDRHNKVRERLSNMTPADVTTYVQSKKHELL